MVEFERKRRQFTEINLIALIDIVFHLLVFVILTTTFVVSESMELSLPSGKAESGAKAAAGMARIQIIHDGSVVVNGISMHADQLTVVLADKVADNPEVRIAVYTTEGVSVQQLVSVLDTVYLTGGRNVQVDKAVAHGF